MFRKLSEFKNLEEVKDWIRVQVELERVWEQDDRDRGPRARGLNALEPEVEGEEPTEADMQALFSIGPTSPISEILAVQNRFKRFASTKGRSKGANSGGKGSGKGGNPWQDGNATLPGAARKPKCANCGLENHETKDCRRPRLAMGDRLCHDCGKPGHISKNCPNKGRAANVAGLR